MRFYIYLTLNKILLQSNLLRKGTQEKKFKHTKSRKTKYVSNYKVSPVKLSEENDLSGLQHSSMGQATDTILPKISVKTKNCLNLLQAFVENVSN